MRGSRTLALLSLILGAGVISCQGKEAGPKHSTAVSRAPIDIPDESFGVLAVFMGCVPLSAGGKPLSCPGETTMSCRADTYWCQKVDGSRHGPTLKLFSTGARRLLQQYLHGKRDGTWMQWDPEGKRIRDGRYVKGKKEGRWHGWHSTGQPFYLHEYRDGYRHGRWARWSPDGFLEAEGFYHFGNMVGRWRERGEDGEMDERVYVDGKPMGSDACSAR